MDILNIVANAIVIVADIVIIAIIIRGWKK